MTVTTDEIQVRPAEEGGVPRYSVLTVNSGAGATLGVYDAKTVPPAPHSFRPI